MTVLLDEIYSRLKFDGKHASGLKVVFFNIFYLKNYMKLSCVCVFQAFGSNCVMTTGFSKWSSAGGWRLGYAVVPDPELRLLF